jgi:hypothetical protein
MAGAAGAERSPRKLSSSRQQALTRRRAGHRPAGRDACRALENQLRSQVSGEMRTSGPGSATMLEVPAGVAQLAERPSCKRQVSGSIPLTGSTFSYG